MNKTIIIVIIVIIVIIIVLGGTVIFLFSNNDEQVNQNQNTDEVSGQKELVQGPKIEVSTGSHDFGTVIYGDVVEHNFTITNIGNQPLEILRLSTSCGCTEASMEDSDKTIAPGKSVLMRVTFDPAVHKDDSDLGNLTRIVYIKTNDPANPEIEVTINAFVVKEDSNSQNDQVKIIKMTAKKWEFSPNPIKVKQGDKVRLEIESIDVAHSFALPDFNIDQRLEAGEKVVVEFLADKKGTFDFHCTIFCGTGHSNMNGQLIIE